MVRYLTTAIRWSQLTLSSRAGVLCVSMWPFARGRQREARERVAAHFAAKAERARRRAEDAVAWRAAGPVTPQRVRDAYEARLGALSDDLRPFARPVAAWSLRPEEPGVDGSHMGGAPALLPDEPWPDGPMRFWAQLNLVDLAPYAAAYRINMPPDGLLQLFAADSSGELARYVPAAEVPRLELRRDIPLATDWVDPDEGRCIEATSLLIELHPEALIDWHQAPEGDFRTSDDLPGYSFGWWPFSPPDDAETLTFLAVCNSNRDLGLAYSDEGFLWASIPTTDLATGDFTRLRCEGESS